MLPLMFSSVASMMQDITSTTSSRRPLSRAALVNIGAMVVAIAAIVWQIAVGVDYPTVPPGPIILGVAVVLVYGVRALWTRIIGVVVPLFLVVGGTIASVASDDNALRHPADTSAFIATVVQMAAVVVALVAGATALREQSG
jgi:hypothetical protein